MTYSSGGLIQASDYNNIIGSNSTTSGTINYVLSTGNGQYGYGQTALGTVSQAGLVTAAQWSSAVGKLNSLSAHQTSSLSIGLPTSGGLVQYLSSVTSGVTQINTNHNSFASQGSTTTGSTFSPTFTGVQPLQLKLGLLHVLVHSAVVMQHVISLMPADN